MPDDSPGPLPRNTRLILACLATKFLLDGWSIAVTWPDFSIPKLGIASAVPFVVWGLVKRWNWAMGMAGVVCFFWIAFLVARSVGPFLTVGDLDIPYPWSNLIALPAIVLVLNSLRFDDEAENHAA